MANQETQKLDTIISSRRAMLAVGGAALASLAFAPKATAQAAITDFDILNFALNLEYLEAQFYTLAVYGITIDKLPTPIPVSINGGTGGYVTLKPSFTPVPFTLPTIKAYATETAIEEGKHVSFLQNTLGTKAVSMPSIDLYNSFNGLATAAGIGGTFDPFASDANFLIGAYIFEDVGVTAYHGAAKLIQDKKGILPAALGIHAVEAYHAGLVRVSISGLDTDGTLVGYTQKISNLRAMLANPLPAPTTAVPKPVQVVDDIGITSVNVSLNTTMMTGTGSTATLATPYAATTISDADVTAMSIAPGRTTAQVISIVTSGNVNKDNTGGFFPNALNGTIGAKVVATPPA